MTMESPVRICLGATLVVHLLLLSTTVDASALPETTTTERLSRVRANGTWTRKNKTPDVALNELQPKDSASEENTDKNAKYKDRGRVRFGAQLKSSTESSLRRARTSSTTQAGTKPSLIIVTPTPEVKKPAQIIDSMRTYKKTKMPVVISSTTRLPVTVKTEEKHVEEEYDDDDEEEEKESFEKYTSSKFDSNFFTIPSYNDDMSHDSEGSDNKVKSDYSRSPFGTFSSYFPEVSGKDNKNDEPYKSESFFDFDSELTTPKNDFFDKKFEQISKSIIKNLDIIKAKAPPPNATNVYKIIHENVGLEKLNNGAPTNKSTVIIKNTKEIRLLDNEGAAGSSNKALSDVHGTSIYYEMSVLSTETYNINHTNDDDCENDTLPEPTVSTSSEQELASLKATEAPFKETTKPIRAIDSESISTLSSNYLPFSSVGPSYFSSVSPIPFSTQNSERITTEKSTRIFTSSFTRNRNYSKRLNLTGINDSPNSVTKFEQSTAVPIVRIPSRKFHYTTPKTKPIWMAPRRNVTRTSYTRSTFPTTIYSEHFSIKDRLSTTPRPIPPSRTMLTTVSSEIDPVLQSDVGGVKKVVHSPSISDNSIPTLWKRGSTKFVTSTAASSESESQESGISDLEIPPTLTAWALASLISPPSLSPAANYTGSTQKSVDENELQKVGELTDKKYTTSSTTTTTASAINNEIIPTKITEIDQNRLPWRPGPSPVQAHTESTPTETKSERLPAESNISIQSSAESINTTEKIKTTTTESTTNKSQNYEEAAKQSWISATEEQTTTEEPQDTIPPVDATKSTGFESITKLPAGLTTPQDETDANSEDKTETSNQKIPTTTDYEITTIRFSYVPTETEKENTTPSAWHPVFPTRTKATTIKDEPITTYRPNYSTTTDFIEESTTISYETTSELEVSSQIIENITETLPEPTETSEEVSTEMLTTTTVEVTKPTTTSTTTTTKTTAAPVETTTLPSETPTMIITVITEINTEKEQPRTSTTEVASSTEVSSSTEVTETPPSEIRKTDSSSEENSGSNEVITQETSRMIPSTTAKQETTVKTTTETETEATETTKGEETTTEKNAKIYETTVKEETTVEVTTEAVRTSEEELTSFAGDVTTEASSIVLTTDGAGSGAAVAIAVSTIGVIALILLVGLLDEP